MKQIVGISFSSRNRPDTLGICLTEIYKFISPEKYEYVIVVAIDLGDPAWDPHYAALKENFTKVIWHKSTQRLGIAKIKNCGLKILKENDCDHFFLFDDDAFPVKQGWDELYIETANQNSIHHLMHQFPLPVGYEITRNENGVCEYALCCGMLLYFTKHAINTIGGYRKQFGIYGFEHVELSLRCNFAGLQPNWGPYISPEKTRDYIYSLDLDLNNWGIQPPHFEVTSEMWRSSIQGEIVEVHVEYNSQFLSQREPVFEEI
jgi:hypothetical protein